MRKISILFLGMYLILFEVSTCRGLATSSNSSDTTVITIEPQPIGAAYSLSNLLNAQILPYDILQGTEANLYLQTSVEQSPNVTYYFEIYDNSGQLWKRVPVTKSAYEIHTISFPISSEQKPGSFTYAISLFVQNSYNGQCFKLAHTFCSFSIREPLSREFGESRELSESIRRKIVEVPRTQAIEVPQTPSISELYGAGKFITQERSDPLPPFAGYHMAVYSGPPAYPGSNIETNIADQKGEGPGSPISLLVDIRRDIEPEDVLNVQLFEDKNPESGLYYYLPKAYNLIWDQDTGYRIRMSYLAAAEPGQAGNVLMDLDLDAGTNEFALKTVKLLLQNYADRHHKRFSELVPFPFEGLPTASFSNDFADLYSVPKVVSHELSDFLAPFRVSWVTDSVTKENMQLALIDLGLNGTLNLASAGNTAKSIVVKINLADPGTFGELRWTRDQPVRNATPYPLRVKYLHALLLQANQREPIIYSWDLHNTAIPPGSAVELGAAAIPSWLNNAALRVWIEYGIAEKSESYNVAAIEEITGGVNSRTQSDLVFYTLGVFSGTTIYEVEVQVRSQFFDPRSTKVQTKYITLNEDRKEYRISGIYYGNWEYKGAEEQQPLFEYLFTVIMPDGTSYPSKWIPSNKPRVQLGTSQIKETLGFLPGEKKDL